MRKRVVANIESRIEPAVERVNPCVALAIDVELTLVHKHDDRHFFRDEALTQRI
jgi:hypothetical protein